MNKGTHKKSKIKKSEPKKVAEIKAYIDCIHYQIDIEGGQVVKVLVEGVDILKALNDRIKYLENFIDGKLKVEVK